jgi:RCC1 and BTB domain-containing protein
VGLSECGRVFTWGNGDHGKLGHGDVLKSATPKCVDSFGEMKVLRVVSYNEHTVAQLCGVGGGAGGWDSRSLSMDMGRLWECGLFADITFVTPAQRVPAHRAVLSARCEHFR